MKKTRGFTLIELISVLVMLAILALITTPLIMNIVKKVKISADKRSVDAYGKSVELAVAGYLMDYGNYPSDLSSLTVEYSGNDVTCNVMNLNEDGSIYLSECTVKGREVKDDTDDGWYHFGKSSAVAYQSYSIGDIVTYNGIDFYVIENSGEDKDTVHLLKEKPLTYEETVMYGCTSSRIFDDIFGEIPYDNTDPKSTDYEISDIKKIVDLWSSDNIASSDLTTDDTGYKVRLLTFDELTSDMGYKIFQNATSSWGQNDSFNIFRFYTHTWTMSRYGESENKVWKLMSSQMFPVNLDDKLPVNPVINLKKSAL